MNNKIVPSTILDNHPMFLIHNVYDPLCKNATKITIFQFYKIENNDLFLILTGKKLTEFKIKPSIELFKSGVIISFIKSPIFVDIDIGEKSDFLICYNEQTEFSDFHNRFENTNLEMFTYEIFISLLKDIIFIFDDSIDKKSIVNKFNDLKFIDTRTSIVKKYVSLLIPPNLKKEFGSTYESEMFLNEVYEVIISYLSKEVLS